VFEYKQLRKIFQPKMYEAEVRSIYVCAGRVAKMLKRRNSYRILLGKTLGKCTFRRPEKVVRGEH
jgi:hypothetical protein